MHQPGPPSRTQAQLAERIKELKDARTSLSDIATILNEEKAPSLSGKKWSSYMVMNYGKKVAKTRVVTKKPKIDEALNYLSTAAASAAVDSSAEYDLGVRIQVLEQRLLEEIMKNIDLQTKIAAMA